jgi:tripartite-type tricarboxylate transporter receptor subunit TctC
MKPLHASRRAVLLALLPATLGFAPSAHAQAGQPWPSAKPIRLIVPFPAGGATDIVARLLSQKLSAALGQQVVVDNKPGAGGTLGADLAAKAVSDGYTLLLSTSSTHSIAPALNAKLPYDAFNDFTPIAHVATAPSVLVVGPNFPAKTAQELVALIKANPGKYNFGSSGIGAYPHLAAEMFKWRAGNLFAVHIPYRGTALVVTDLMAGQIHFMMDSIVSAQSHLKEGRMRALAVSGTKRSASLPQVPTFGEVGVANMALSNWFGVFGPAGLDAAVATRLNRELNAVVAAPDVAERLTSLGAEAAPGGSTAAFATLVRDEKQSWQALIERAKIKAE